MRRVVLLEHISLDGYLAAPDGDMEWIHVDDELWEYLTPVIDAADTVVYGRKTYEMMQAYWPNAASDPNATPHDIHHGEWVRTATKLIFSRTLPSAPWDASGEATLIRDDVAGVIAQMRQESHGRDVLVLGSASLARKLIAGGLVDDYRLQVNPIVLGGGTPLFPETATRRSLGLVSSRSFASGVAALHYTLPTRRDL
jgi:dihydrofolate reductase